MPTGDYSIDPLRFIRDQVKDLRENKADKAVVKSEFKGVQVQIKNNEDDIDEVKAQIITEKPHACLREGEIGNMKKAIEDNTKMSEQAFKTASLASDRGFKILMGAVVGLVTFGVAFCAWAFSVSYSASTALEKAEAIELRVEAKPQPDYIPPQIIIASPEYIEDRMADKAPVVPEAGVAVDLEGLLEQALTKALERQADPLSDL